MQRILTAYEAQECNMSLRVHYLHLRIACYPEHLEGYSEEQDKTFQQDVRNIETPYQRTSLPLMREDSKYSYLSNMPTNSFSFTTTK